jgi:hypothetical protein
MSSTLAIALDPGFVRGALFALAIVGGFHGLVWLDRAAKKADSTRTQQQEI